MNTNSTLITYSVDRELLLRFRETLVRDLQAWKRLDHFTAQEDVEYASIRIIYLQGEINKIDEFLSNSVPQVQYQAIMEMINTINLSIRSLLRTMETQNQRIERLQAIVNDLSSYHN